MRFGAHLPTLAIAVLSLSFVASCADANDPTAAQQPPGRSSLFDSTVTQPQSAPAPSSPTLSNVTATEPSSAPATETITTDALSTEPSTRIPTKSANLGEPVEVSVAAIGVSVPLFHLSLDDEGRLMAPKDPDDAGWWQHKGSTVIVGHVDSKSGPAVFYRVRELRSGDSVKVTFANGQKKTFIADDVRQVDKNAFPTDDVYRAGPGTLRLVTCGGAFDRKTGHYKDNIIVFATEAVTNG